ncbi:ribbon-helix-helix protein, CopG family [Leucobacter insecticola]|uniref:Ribbon-helix-helix protein, CopG family n=1 Tax=Leucobacter insecticola TaxID=2714934 RepID=A0A6G8FHC6_9MICO|nr:CopG family transcriptional regulator [Leucobacter insecticola]QIM15679.1 ribbon-helix-helix protein, CopG family [Leucobacter insecticola]
MATLDKRVQVLFDPERYAALESEARARGISAGALIRAAVDEHLETKSHLANTAWEELWHRVDSDPNSYPPLDWEEAQAAYEREMDPFYRLAKSNGENSE